jgi:hypothetical protein
MAASAANRQNARLDTMDNDVPSTADDGSDFELALRAIRTEQTVDSVVRDLEAVAGRTGDAILKIHIDEVLRALRSRLLVQLYGRKIRLPLDLVPYKGLAAYCARRSSTE